MSVSLHDHQTTVSPFYWELVRRFASDAFAVRHALADVVLLRVQGTAEAAEETDQQAQAVLAEFLSPELKQSRRTVLWNRLSPVEQFRAERFHRLKEELEEFFVGAGCWQAKGWMRQTLERLGFALVNGELPVEIIGEGVIRNSLELARRLLQVAHLVEEQQFAALLARLHPDARQAGEEYEKLRDRLIHFFEARQWQISEARRFPDVSQAADEVLNRLAEKIHAETERATPVAERVQNVKAFALGMARLVWQELQAESSRLPEMPLPPLPSPNRLRQMQAACLQTLKESQRRLLIRYCGCTVLDEQNAARYRRQLIEEFGFKDAKALHQSISYLRRKLECCVARRMQQLAKTDFSATTLEPEEDANDTLKF
ncbi:MAG: hypothetical protein K1Y36_00535 [Blastocatellia bacterium]|nr:hypothetical protein [Blastocatellia bacterium]